MALRDWPAYVTPADVPGGLVPLIVAGEAFAPGVLGGDVHTVLSYVAAQLNARVEPVAFPGGHPADDWGWAFRPNKNDPTKVTKHARALAFDYNATRHPNGKRGTWAPEKVRVVRRILAEVDGLVLWGEDFPTPDGMHFELDTNRSPAEVAAVARRIRGDDDEGDDELRTDERQALMYLVGQMAGQDRPQSAGGGWSTSDKGVFRSLVDLARTTFEALKLTRVDLGKLAGEVKALRADVAKLQKAIEGR